MALTALQRHVEHRARVLWNARSIAPDVCIALKSRVLLASGLAVPVVSQEGRWEIGMPRVEDDVAGGIVTNVHALAIPVWSTARRVRKFTKEDPPAASGRHTCVSRIWHTTEGACKRTICLIYDI